MKKNEKDTIKEEELNDVQDGGLDSGADKAPVQDGDDASAAQETAEEVIELDGEQIKALLEKAEKADEYHNLLLRTRAEFDNFRKRTRSESAQMAKLANESLLSQILPVADNFERALSIGVAHENDEQTSGDMKSFIQGVRLTHKQLLDVMTRAGLERIETEPGAAFDPRLHEAMAMVETDEVGDGCILDEFLAGYTIGDRVVRAAAVRIAKAPAKEEAAADEDEKQADNV